MYFNCHEFEENAAAQNRPDPCRHLLLGVDVKPIFGMNRGAVYPAFERGELNLDFFH